MLPPEICTPLVEHLQAEVTMIRAVAGTIVGALVVALVFVAKKWDQERTDRLSDAQKVLPVLDEGVKIMRDLTTRRSRR